MNLNRFTFLLILICVMASNVLCAQTTYHQGMRLILCSETDMTIEAAEESESFVVSKGAYLRLHEEAPNYYICYYKGKQLLFPADLMLPIEEARDYYAQACIDDPGCENFAIKANIEDTLGNYEQAFEDLDRADEFESDHPFATLVRSSVHFSLEEYVESGELVEKVIDMDDVSVRLMASAHSTKASVLSRSDEHQEGLELITKAIEICPNVSQFHANRGYFLKQAGKLPEAIEEFKRAIELNPSATYGYFRLGYEHYTENDFDKAQPLLEKACALDPMYYYSQFYLYALHEKKGNHEQYVRHLTLAAKCLDCREYTLYDCAWLLATHPNESFRDSATAKELATIHLKRFGDEDSNRARGVICLVAAHLGLGEFEEAAKLIDDSDNLNLGPDEFDLRSAIENQEVFIDEDLSQ